MMTVSVCPTMYGQLIILHVFDQDDQFDHCSNVLTILVVLYDFRVFVETFGFIIFAYNEMTQYEYYQLTHIIIIVWSVVT